MPGYRNLLAKIYIPTIKEFSMPASKKPRKKYNPRKHSSSSQQSPRKKTIIDFKAIQEDQQKLEDECIESFWHPIKDKKGNIYPERINQLGRDLGSELNKSCYQYDEDKYRYQVREIGESLNYHGGFNCMKAVFDLIPDWGQSEISKMWNGIGEWRD